MSLLSSTAAGILRPEEVGELIVKPVQQLSVAMQIAKVVPTTSSKFRIPVVNSDVSSAWTPEGSDINPSDPDVDEVEVEPRKLAVLTKVSRELASDSSPAATDVVGQSIARDIAKKIDKAFFAETTANGPAGVQSATGRQVIVVSPAYTNLDPFSEAVSRLEDVGATVTGWVTNSTTALTLAKLKTESGSNQPLLQPDPTLPTRRSILGAPLFVVQSGTIEDGTVYAFDKSRVFAVLREDVTLDVDPSFYFGSDSLAVRGTLRVAFAFPHEQAIVELSNSGS